MTKYLETRNNKGYPSLRRGVGDIMRRISATLPDLKEPIKMYLAGGMAVNFYTGYRPDRGHRCIVLSPHIAAEGRRPGRDL